MKILLSIIVVLCLHTTSFPDSVLKKVAVIDFFPNGCSPVESKVVTEYFRSILSKLECFSLYERSNMSTILKEQGFQQSGACTQTDCAIEIGKLLSVPHIIIGTVSKLDNSYTLSARMINVESGFIEQEANPITIEGTIEELLPHINPMVYEIAGQPIDKKSPKRKIIGFTVGTTALVTGAVLIPLLLKKDKSDDQSQLGKVKVKW